MAETNTDQSGNLETLADFSWDSLPELAKERWEQAVAYSSAVENQLAKAKASRTRAEVERQRIANEILSATKEACQSVVGDAKKALARIKATAKEAEQNQQDTQRELTDAKSIRAEADAYRVTVLAEAQQQAGQILERARSEATAESEKLKQQILHEAQRTLALAEAMRAAAREEMEAQKIYSEAAMLKADAHQALAQLKTDLDLPFEPLLALEVDGFGGAGLPPEIANGRPEMLAIEQPPDPDSSSERVPETPEQPSTEIITPEMMSEVESGGSQDAQVQSPTATNGNLSLASETESPAVHKTRGEEQPSPANPRKPAGPQKTSSGGRHNKSA